MESSRTFFVTTVTAQRRRIFQTDAMACLFIETLFRYRDGGKFALHEFVLMPDHFHALLTPAQVASLEKAMQYIKGGFSFRAKRELRYPGDVWEASFTNHRIRDAEDYARHAAYILRNPEEGGLPVPYPYCSATVASRIDAPPLGLKPSSSLHAVTPG